MTANGLREAEDSHARNLLRFRITALLATGLPVLAGCQTGIGVSVLNECGGPLETRVNDVHDEWHGSWTPIAADRREEGRWAAAEVAKNLYVQVRARKGESPIQFAVAVADLPKPPPGVDDDVEIVLIGNRCPRAAS